MYEYRVEIRRVVDGDTVDVDIDLGFGVWLHNERIRVDGIDTPECRTRDLVEKQFGKLASALVESMIPVGSQQIMVTTEYDPIGKYGRILGTFIIYDAKTESEKTLSEVMIREGYAVEYHGQSKDDIEAEHLENRRTLIESGAIEMTLTEAGLL